MGKLDDGVKLQSGSGGSGRWKRGRVHRWFAHITFQIIWGTNVVGVGTNGESPHWHLNPMGIINLQLRSKRNLFRRRSDWNGDIIWLLGG